MRKKVKAIPRPVWNIIYTYGTNARFQAEHPPCHHATQEQAIDSLLSFLRTNAPAIVDSVRIETVNGKAV